MANDSEFKYVCSYSANIECWEKVVGELNKLFATLMIPVEVFMVLLLIVGILGNTLVLIVYINRKTRTTAHIFTMYLAGIDLLACSVIHPYVIYKLFNHLNQTWSFACKVFEYMVHASLATSSLALLAIAIDRYLAICKPVQSLGFHRHIYKIITASFVLGTVVSLPLLEFYGINSEPLMVNNVPFEGFKCDYKRIYQETTAMTAYSSFMLSGFLVEFVAMAVLYKCVAYTAYHSRRTVRPTGINAASSSSRTAVNPSVPTTTGTSLTLPSSSSQFEVSAKSNFWAKQTIQETQHVEAECQQSNITARNESSRDLISFGVNQSNRDAASKSFSSSLKAAKVLFLVTAVFFLSWLPFFILRICYTIDKNYWTDNSPARMVLEHFLNHFFYLNNAVNPIIYSLINKNFRHDCYSIIKRRCR